MSTVSTMSSLIASPEARGCSDRRAAANRANARKSTGPRSPRGKARSALNALKTGCFARTPLIPGERPEEMDDFVAEIVEDLAPATPVERDLAERVAGLSWRRRRLWRAEEEVIAREFGDPGELKRSGPPADAEDDGSGADAQAAHELQVDNRMRGQMFLAEQYTGREPGPLVRIADHERRLSGSIDASLRMLLKMQDRRARREQEEDEARETDAAPAVRNEAIGWEPQTPGVAAVTERPCEPRPVARNEAIGNSVSSIVTCEPSARNEANSSGPPHAGGVDWGAVISSAVGAVRAGPLGTHRPGVGAVGIAGSNGGFVPA